MGRWQRREEGFFGGQKVQRVQGVACQRFVAMAGPLYDGAGDEAVPAGSLFFVGEDEDGDRVLVSVVTRKFREESKEGEEEEGVAEAARAQAELFNTPERQAELAAVNQALGQQAVSQQQSDVIAVRYDMGKYSEAILGEGTVMERVAAPPMLGLQLGAALGVAGPAVPMAMFSDGRYSFTVQGDGSGLLSAGGQ